MLTREPSDGVVCTEQIWPLLCGSENGAFLLNLSSHPRTAHKHTPYCAPTRKGTQDAPSKPTTTSYRAISVEIVVVAFPTLVVTSPLYNRLATTPCTCSWIQV